MIKFRKWSEIAFCYYLKLLWREIMNFSPWFWYAPGQWWAAKIVKRKQLFFFEGLTKSWTAGNGENLPRKLQRAKLTLSEILQVLSPSIWLNVSQIKYSICPPVDYHLMLYKVHYFGRLCFFFMTPCTYNTSKSWTVWVQGIFRHGEESVLVTLQ